MDVIRTAKKVIVEELEKVGFKVVNIILFGSRARGNFNKDSDWDFFVIIDREIAHSIKRDIIGRIQIRFAYLKIPNDIIIVSENRYQERMNDVGHITYYAMKDGIKL